MTEFFGKIGANFTSLGEALKKNTGFVLSFLGIIIAVFLVAFLLEKLAQKRRGVSEKVFTTRKMAMVGMFSAIATILMMFEIPMPFAPVFSIKK